jgi:hypothetical protein
MECAYRSSSCLSLEMEKGMSPYSKFPDKSLQRQEKNRDQLKNAYLQQKGSNTIKEDLDLGTYRYFKETQSPISSGIWPVSLFSLRSLHEQIISTQIN